MYFLQFLLDRKLNMLSSVSSGGRPVLSTSAFSSPTHETLKTFFSLSEQYTGRMSMNLVTDLALKRLLPYSKMVV